MNSVFKTKESTFNSTIQTLKNVWRVTIKPSFFQQGNEFER